MSLAVSEGNGEDPNQSPKQTSFCNKCLPKANRGLGKISMGLKGVH